MKKSLINPVLSGKKLIFIFCLFILTAVTTYAQAPNILWTKTIGDSLNQSASSIVQSPDGGFVIAGPDKGFWGYLYFVKTDSNGDTIWTRTYQNQYHYACIASSIEMTSDSCYIIAGTWGCHCSHGVILTKINSLGDTLWINWNLRGTSGTEARETLDGGYIFSTNFDELSNGLLVKTDSIGNESWWRAYQDEISSVVQVDDSGFVFTGDGAYLTKTNSNGYTLWRKTYNLPGGTGSSKKVIKASDGCFIILTDSWLIKTNEFGDTLWTKNYKGGEVAEGLSIQQTTDNGYIITGFTTSIWGDKDVWILRTDSLGNTLWTKTIGGNDDEVGNSVKQTADGGYIVCGYITYSIPGGESDVLLIRLAPDTLINVKNKNEFVNDYHLFQNYPNPFNPVTTIKYQIPKTGLVILRVYDVLGKEVATLVNEKQGAGSYEVEFNGKDYLSGVYFYKLETEGFTNTRKMILLK